MPETRAMTRNDICEEILWKKSDGLTPYPDALDFMATRSRQIHDGTADPVVWLVEHPLSLRPERLLSSRIFITHITTRRTKRAEAGSGRIMARDRDLLMFF